MLYLTGVVYKGFGKCLLGYFEALAGYRRPDTDTETTTGMYFSTKTDAK